VFQEKNTVLHIQFLDISEEVTAIDGLKQTLQVPAFKPKCRNQLPMCPQSAAVPKKRIHWSRLPSKLLDYWEDACEAAPQTRESQCLAQSADLFLTCAPETICKVEERIGGVWNCGLLSRPKKEKLFLFKRLENRNSQIETSLMWDGNRWLENKRAVWPDARECRKAGGLMERSGFWVCTVDRCSRIGLSKKSPSGCFGAKKLIRFYWEK